jgi:hypothetical protein
MSADTIARLKVTLDDVKPAILRRIEVPFDIRLDRLHLTIQAAMGWTGPATSAGARHIPMRTGQATSIDARKARLGDILEDIGTKTLVYL